MAGNHNSGRPSLSIEDHKLRGSYKPGRHGQRPPAPAVMPLPADRFEPPAFLDDVAKEFWLDNRAELLRLDLLDTFTFFSFCILCQTYSMQRRLGDIVAAAEPVITTPRGVKIAHPAIRAHHAVTNQLLKMLEGWGMTPKGRRGLGIKTVLRVEAEPDPMSEYNLSGVPSRVATRGRGGSRLFSGELVDEETADILDPPAGEPA
jgi:phage terminase small subunit